MTSQKLRIATRGSTLAVAQAEMVKEALLRLNPSLDIELVLVKSYGDLHPNLSLSKIGGQGVFINEIRKAVLSNKADICVHSLKDLPTYAHNELVMPAVLKRGDVRDALVGKSLKSLKSNATVATGSQRRLIQLKALRDDLNFIDLRGNIITRLKKIPKDGAIVVAYAALKRLGLEEKVAEILETETVIPQVGQGAIAVECRAKDFNISELLKEINDLKTFKEVTLERVFLENLGAGCSQAVGAYAQSSGSKIAFSYLVGRPNGSFLRSQRILNNANAFKVVAEIGKECQSFMSQVD